jgi:hypothetical protein
MIWIGWPTLWNLLVELPHKFFMEINALHDTFRYVQESTNVAIMGYPAPMDAGMSRLQY